MYLAQLVSFLSIYQVRRSHLQQSRYLDKKLLVKIIVNFYCIFTQSFLIYKQEITAQSSVKEDNSNTSLFHTLASPHYLQSLNCHNEKCGEK